MTMGRVLKKKLGAIQSRGYNYPILTTLVAKLEHAAAKGGGSALGLPVEAIVKQSRVERIGALIDTLPMPGLFTVMTSERGDTALVGFDIQLVDHVVDILAGGEPNISQSFPARTPTAIDAALCGRLIDGMINLLSEEISQMAGEATLAQLRRGQIEHMPMNLHYLLPDQQYLTYHISLDIGEDARNGDLFVAIPLSWIEPVEAALSKVRFIRAQGESDNWSAHMRRVVQQSPLRISAVIDLSRMQVAELTRFEVGELLPLADATIDNVTLVLRAGGSSHPIGRGRLGVFRHNKAIKIVEPPDPSLLGPLMETLATEHTHER